MKKRLQKFGEDLIPLSRKQSFLLITLIACIFQFLLFFTPALAAETVNAQEQEISLGEINKSAVLDLEAAKIITESIQKNSVETSASTSTDIIVSTSVHVMTAYNSEVGQTDDSPCITANGFNVCEHNKEDTIAANFLKLGTKVKIPDLYGDRIFIVRDRMNKKHPDRIDIWMKERSAAIKFGVKTARIQVLK